MNGRKPARQWAAELVECWLARRPHADVLDQVPGWQRDMVLEMARSSCQIIDDHARRVVASGRVDDVPRQLLDVVDRRIASVRRQ